MYRIKYRLEIESGHWTKEEVDTIVSQDAQVGFTDALLVVSSMIDPEGGRDQLQFGIDGRTGKELEPIEVFKIWHIMSHWLSRDGHLPVGSWQRGLAETTFETGAEIVRARMAIKPKDEPDAQ